MRAIAEGFSVSFVAPVKRSHFADSSKSTRLRKMLDALADMVPHTTRELMYLTGSCAVHSDVHELRKNGYTINSHYVGLTQDRRKVFSYQLSGTVYEKI